METIALVKTIIYVIAIAVIFFVLKKAITEAVKKEINEALDSLENLVLKYKEVTGVDSEGGKSITPSEQQRLIGLFANFINELYDVVKSVKESGKLK